MIWGMVMFSEQGGWKKEIDQVKCAFPNAKSYLINNKSGQAAAGEYQGNNLQFEFGGYLQLTELMLLHEGPYLILNDTLFRTHHTRGWLQFLSSKAAQWTEFNNVIMGDIRKDGSQFVERPNPFLASWIFVIPNKDTLLGFQDALKKTIISDVDLMSSEYREFLNGWVLPKSKLRGWHGVKDSMAIDRKRRCVFWEHTLSKLLLNDGVDLIGFDHWSKCRYQQLRVVDRFNTRIQAWLR